MLLHISFGDKIVTKLSERPYYISLALVLTILLYLNTMSFFTNVVYYGKLQEFYYYTIKHGTMANVLNTVSFIIRMDLCLAFIACRVYEQEALLLFVQFQKDRRLNTI